MGPATFTSSVNLNVPANVNLMMLQGSVISMNISTTLTLNGGMAGSSVSTHFTGVGSVKLSSTVIPEIYPQWWGATGNGSTDDTAAIQAAYTAAAQVSLAGGIGAIVVFPAGTYKITSQITSAGSFIYTRGAGAQATQWLFAPTANGTCFLVSQAATSAFTVLGGISGISIYSNDATFVKTALNVVACRSYTVEDVAIYGGVVKVGTAMWSDNTNASIGIQTNGHEAVSFNRLLVAADRPILLGKNPLAAAANIDADHFNFNNCLLTGNLNPIYDCQANIFVDRLSIGGYQAWVAGTDGFRYVSDASETNANRPMIRIENVGREQVQTTTAHLINIQLTGGALVRGLTLRNFNGPMINQGHGILLRGINGAVIESVHYLGNGVALDLDSSSSGFMFLDNSFTEAGGTLSTTGFTGFVMYDKVTQTESYNTFDHTGLINLANQTYISELNASAVSKRLIGVNTSNMVSIDQDAMNANGMVIGNQLRLGGYVGASSRTGFIVPNTWYLLSVNGAGTDTVPLLQVNASNFITMDADAHGVITGGFLTVNGTLTASATLAASANLTVTGRLQQNLGATIASAATITLGATGNVFIVTGNVGITNMTITGWQAGSMVTLIFTGTPTITNLAGGSGQLVLRAGVNLVCVAQTTHTFAFDGTAAWYQVD